MCAKVKHKASPIEKKIERSRNSGYIDLNITVLQILRGLTVFSSIQQSYEHCDKLVKDEREAELSSEVSPEMMSDKEKDVCHQPHYRSRSLNSFIKKFGSKLDSTKGIEKYPRLNRRLGSPHEKPIPE